jgi:hypothetical protein
MRAYSRHRSYLAWSRRSKIAKPVPSVRKGSANVSSLGVHDLPRGLHPFRRWRVVSDTWPLSSSTYLLSAPGNSKERRSEI